jgi:hypothetical protein
MIDFNIITPCLFNVLGWKNTNNTCEKPLNPAIFTDASETGMYYNLNSELLTLPNLQAIAPNSDLFDYDNWIGGVGYSADDIIRYDKILYKSLVDSNFGNIPSTSPNDWVLLYDFSDWLQNFTNTTILRFAQSIVNLKKNSKQSKALMLDTPVYNGSGSMQNVNNYVPNQSKFVGLELKTIPNRDVNLSIKKIGLHFVDIQTDLPIYIYHSSQLEPLQTINISTTTAKSFVWVNIDDISLNYTNEYASDGVFYIGYYQEDVTGTGAINNDRFNFQAPCISCNRTGAKYWNDFNKFVNVNSFSVADGNYTKGEMWDYELNQYGSNTFGLNVSFTAECTLNNFICDNSQMFSKGLLRQAELLFCEYAINTNRTNELAERMANIAGINLDADGLIKLQSQVDEEIKASNFDLSDLNSPCATKQKTKRTMFRSI